MSYGNYHQWDGIRDMYRNGAKGYFDVVAVHPFTNDKSGPQGREPAPRDHYEQVRKVMRRHREPRKPIGVTEMTWRAALGKVPADAIYGMETTSRGQAARLKAAYGKLAREQPPDAHLAGELVHVGHATTSRRANATAMSSGSPDWSRSSAERVHAVAGPQDLRSVCGQVRGLPQERERPLPPLRAVPGAQS